MAEKKTSAQDTATQTTGTTGRPTGDVVEVDPLIASLERVYQVVTGSTPPPPSEQAYAPIPVERDPGEYVTERLEKLLEAMREPSPALNALWSPPLTVWESDREILLQVELPGVRRQDVEVELENDILTVRGRRSVEQDGVKLRLSERPLGPFERRVQLPRRVERAEPSARLADGLLEVRLGKPRGEESTGRKEIRIS